MTETNAQKPAKPFIYKACKDIQQKINLQEELEFDTFNITKLFNGYHAMSKRRKNKPFKTPPTQRKKTEPKPPQKRALSPTDSLYIQSVSELGQKSAVASKLLMFLARHLTKKNNAVICSFDVLCRELEVSRPTIARAVRLLKDDNWVDVVKVGTVNAYVFNERIKWHQVAFEHRSFNAVVIASQDEQYERGLGKMDNLKPLFIDAEE